MNAFELENKCTCPTRCESDCPCYMIETTINLMADNLYVEFGMPMLNSLNETLFPDAHDGVAYNERFTVSTHNQLRDALRNIVANVVSECDLEPWNDYEFPKEAYDQLRLTEMVIQLDDTLKS